jgi:transketolase
MYASANKVDNIIVTVDYNGQQIDGSTKNVLDIGDLKSKLESFGWEVLEIENGNDTEEIFNTLNKSKDMTGNKKPIIILMKTIMGNGVDFMMHTHEWHGKAPNDDQLAIALNQNPETLGDY